MHYYVDGDDKKIKMSKESLEQRLNELKRLQQERLSEVHQIEGAIQDCLYWMSQIKDTEEEEKRIEDNG